MKFKPGDCLQLNLTRVSLYESSTHSFRESTKKVTVVREIENVVREIENPDNRRLPAWVVRSGKKSFRLNETRRGGLTLTATRIKYEVDDVAPCPLPRKRR
jgi:hypothetical protein